MPASHRRIVGSNPSMAATLLLPSARRFKSVTLLNWLFYSCHTFSCERFQVAFSHLSKHSRTVFVKWHDIALYNSAIQLYFTLTLYQCNNPTYQFNCSAYPWNTFNVFRCFWTSSLITRQSVAIQGKRSV